MAEREAEEEELLKLAEACADDVVEDEAEAACVVLGLRWLAALEGSDSRGIVIQGWRRSSSMRMRSPGLIRRHRLMRSWHSKVRRVRNLISAEQICSSCSKGMLPH